MLDNPIGIGSLSLGRHASHTLPLKIAAAAKFGFTGIEITYGDLELFASSLSASMLEAARQTRKLCKEHSLYIISFAAFENFEGYLSSLEDRLKKAAFWLDITRELGAEHLQVPSTYDRRISNDRDIIVSELRQLSDLASSSNPVIKIAYENLAWSSHCILWQEALQIVQDVDRDNFGLCLDSFHIAVAVWGDPFNASGQQPNGDQQLEESLKSFVKDCPLDKIFYVQLSDGEPFDPPYSKDHPWYDPTLEPGHVWSNEARPFPLESNLGAYMPMTKLARALIVDKRFRGWVSLETFDRRMREESSTPSQNAKRGMDSWIRLKKALLSEPRSRL